MHRPTPRLGAAALAAAVSLLAGSAHAADPPLELVQPGDAEKSCPVLASEINALSEREAKAAQRAESGRKFLGFAGAALQAAAPLLSGKMGGGQGNYMAQQALGSFQQQAMQQAAAQQQMQQQAMQQQMAQIYRAMPGMAGAQPTPEEKPASVAAQRLAHLKGIYGEKAC